MRQISALIYNSTDRGL